MLLIAGLILAAACLASMWMAGNTAFAPRVGDASLIASGALPSSTTLVSSGSIDTGVRSNVAIMQPVELLLTAPALTTGQLPDGKTMTYAIVHSDNADLSASVALDPAAIVQTGADGVGAAGASVRFKTPSILGRYIGFTVTPSASGTGDASGATATLAMLF